jgi:hypothetical protein
MWIYRQKTGELLHDDQHIAVGYSGFSAGKNDPLAQHLVGIGPIPRGVYWIGEAFESAQHGPHSMRLIPVTGTETFGRMGFLIHGDSIEASGSASHGCIVVALKVRERISEDRSPGCKLLVVTSGLPEQGVA